MSFTVVDTRLTSECGCGSNILILQDPPSVVSKVVEVTLPIGKYFSKFFPYAVWKDFVLLQSFSMQTLLTFQEVV